MPIGASSPAARKSTAEVSGSASTARPRMRSARPRRCTSHASAGAQAHAVATGKSNMVDVVTAVAETETAVQTLVSVRDKVIAAYEDILKMPI